MFNQTQILIRILTFSQPKKILFPGTSFDYIVEVITTYWLY